MSGHKDVAVTKLSALQKQILLYARQVMLTKAQTIDAPTEVTLCLRAPRWLDQVLCEVMREIAKARKGYVLRVDPADSNAVYLSGLHPWMRLFAEMTVLRERIEQAAEAAGVKDQVNLAGLHRLAGSFELRLRLLLAEKVAYAPWPYLDGRGWYFTVQITGMSLDQVKADLLTAVPVDAAWAYDNGGGPPNCTIPELLRDLFGFPVQEGGHIDALAFSVETIGARRYGTAQASLRRACQRLQTRGLIDIWSGQESSTSVFTRDVYLRTRIGLTAAGTSVAENLQAKASPFAEPLPPSQQRLPEEEQAEEQKEQV